MAHSSNPRGVHEIASLLPHLRRYGRALTGQQATGDALAAKTLEALLQNRAALDPSLPVRVALFRVFHRAWSDADRLIAVPNPVDSPLEAMAQKRLAKLTPNAREALLLNTVEGFRPDEIASILEVTTSEAAFCLETGLVEVSRQMRGRVLIVEDEPIIAMDLKSIITTSGHSVTGIARTESEALAKVEAEMPDLLLADVQLADGSSGIDAAHAILALKPDLPVVFITAYPERLLTGERPEPAFLITKPFKEKQVQIAVSHSLFFATTAELT